MKVTYIGKQLIENWDGTRHYDAKSEPAAQITFNIKEYDKAMVRINKLESLGWKTSGSFRNDDDFDYYYPLDSKEEYKDFMIDWKSTK